MSLFLQGQATVPTYSAWGLPPAVVVTQHGAQGFQRIVNGRSLCLTVSLFHSFTHSLLDTYFLSEEQITVRLGEDDSFCNYQCLS